MSFRGAKGDEESAVSLEHCALTNYFLFRELTLSELDFSEPFSELAFSLFSDEDDFDSEFFDSELFVSGAFESEAFASAFAPAVSAFSPAESPGFLPA